jgi:hypothetical protein
VQKGVVSHIRPALVLLFVGNEKKNIALQEENAVHIKFETLIDF